MISSLSKYRNLVSKDTICAPRQSSQRTEEKENLVIKERNFLRYILDDQLELEPEVLAGEHPVIIFVDIYITARFLRFGDPLQGV